MEAARVLSFTEDLLGKHAVPVACGDLLLPAPHITLRWNSKKVPTGLQHCRWLDVCCEARHGVNANMGKTCRVLPAFPRMSSFASSNWGRSWGNEPMSASAASGAYLLFAEGPCTMLTKQEPLWCTDVTEVQLHLLNLSLEHENFRVGKCHLRVAGPSIPADQEKGAPRSARQIRSRLIEC